MRHDDFNGAGSRMHRTRGERWIRDDRTGPGLDHHIKLAERRGMADALHAAGAKHDQLVFGDAHHGFFG